MPFNPPPTKKKPVSAFASALQEAATGVAETPVESAEVPKMVAVKSDFAAALQEAASKKKVGGDISETGVATSSISTIDAPSTPQLGYTDHSNPNEHLPAALAQSGTVLEKDIQGNGGSIFSKDKPLFSQADITGANFGAKGAQGVDIRQVNADVIKNNPDALKEYRIKRTEQITAKVNKIKEQQQAFAGVQTANSELGITRTVSTDPVASEALQKQVDAETAYQKDLNKSIADAAIIAVPKSFLSTNKDFNIEDVGKKYDEVIGDPAVKDDTEALATLPNVDADKQEVEIASQFINNNFFKKGAATLAAYHLHTAQEIEKANPEKIGAYKTAVEKGTATPDALQDPIIKQYADAANQALHFSTEAQTSEKYYPQVARQKLRQNLNDKFFDIVTKKDENSNFLNPITPLKLAARAIFGETPTDEEIVQLAKETNVPENQVRDIVNTKDEGFAASSPEGVRVSGFLSGVSQGVDETLANSLMGLRRIFNTNNVEAKNRITQQKSDAYNMSASQNKLYDETGKLNFNPYSIANMAGRGLGQTSLYAAPTLATGGIAEGLAAGKLVAKGVEGLTTLGVGYIGSYEPAYKEVAAYTPNEETRRSYANFVAIANAAPELIMSPADIAKKVGLGAVSKEGLIKSFVNDAEKFGGEEALTRRIARGAGNALQVVGAENIEEQVTNLGTNHADEVYLDRTRNAKELSDQFWQTVVSTTVNMLPMAAGAGVGGFNDVSNIRKQALFEAGHEPEVMKAALKKQFDAGFIPNEQEYNTKVGIVNKMQKIVSNLPETNIHGQPLTYDQKAELAAHEFRISLNNKLKEGASNGNGLAAQLPILETDTKQAIERQTEILTTPAVIISNIVDRPTIEEPNIIKDENTAQTEKETLESDANGADNKKVFSNQSEETENKALDESQVQDTEKPIVEANEGTTISNEPITTNEVKPTEETVNEDKQAASQTEQVGNDAIKELGERKLSTDGGGNWRQEFNERKDPFVKSQILRTIAETNTSDKAFSDILNVIEGMPEESNIAWAIANNPKSSKETFEKAVSNKKLISYTSDENINSLRERRFANNDNQYTKSQSVAVPDRNIQPLNIPQDASVQSSEQQQESNQQSGQQEHARVSTQQDQKTAQTDDSNSYRGSDTQAKPKTKVSRTKASASLRQRSEKIRKEGALPSWLKTDLPEGTQGAGFGGKSLDEAVAKAFDLVADAIDAGSQLSDAVEQGFSHLKDYYSKNAKAFDEKKLRGQFRAEVKANLKDNGGLAGISNSNTESIRKEFGFGEYERSNATDKELEQQADDLIKKGVNVESLIQKLERGVAPSGVENFMLGKYQASLLAKIDDTPSDENIAQLKRLVKALDSIGSLQSEAFRTRQNVQLVDDSLGAFFIREMETREVDQLTDEQKKQVENEFKELREAKKAYEDKLAAIAAKEAKEKAEKELRKIKEATVINKKKTHEDFVKERQTIVGNIKEKLRQARTGQSGLTAVPVPYVAELIAIAPDVARLTKSLVEEGITVLAEVVKNIHASLKEDLPEITESDVHNIIAGEYTQKKKTKNELTKQIYDLRSQAKLITRLQELQNGVQPKKEEDKRVRNAEIEELKKQISEHDLTKLATAKARIKGEISKVEQLIKDGKYENEKRPELKLDKEGIDLKDKLIKLRQDRELRLLKQQYANRSKREKLTDNLVEVANVPRTLMSSLDYSAPLRQSVIATVAHPALATKAGIEMFKQSVSQKRFDRWFFDLRESPRYKLMEQSGLYVADPHDPRLSLKEEAFMNNLAEKIPLVGGLIKGSERAYVGYLNKMRVDLFNQVADAYENEGKTIDNSPELFKGLASFVNNVTGRGGMSDKMESASPILNSMFFSPRLIASRLNILGLSDIASGGSGFYGKMPKEIRIMALKDIAKFISVGAVILSALKLAWGCDDGEENDCFQVEIDPRSSDFGKIRYNNTRWDVWGGMQQYVRIMTQLLSGQTKSINSGKIQSLSGDGLFGKTRLDVASSFVRGKLAPIPSMAIDALKGRNTTGEPVTLKEEALQHLLPLLATDMTDAIKDNGIKAIFTVGVPSTFGVGVQTYLPRGFEKVDVKKDPVFKFLYDKRMQLTPPTLTDIPADKTEAFIGKRQEIFKTEWKNVIEYGAMIDRKGNPTTDVRKGVRIKPKDALTYDDLAGLMKSISMKSARRAKKQLGIEPD